MGHVFKSFFAVGAALACCGIARAGISNDIPSCYVASRVGLAAPASKTELFVLVDQTTPLDQKLQASVRENVGRLVQPGVSFVIASFSSFGQGRYLEVLTAGALEEPIEPKTRDSISVKLLRNFDACMNGQLNYGRKTAAEALNRALAGSSLGLVKSDVMASLKELSGRVRQSSARDRIVFLISDMLENSSVSSFYANRNVRRLDPAIEIRKAEANQMIGDFAGARVFVLGAGLVQVSEAGKNTDSGVYRDPKTMVNLHQFWDRYFANSNARLIEFGSPSLLVPVE